jgi:hypothetical protein
MIEPKQSPDPRSFSEKIAVPLEANGTRNRVLAGTEQHRSEIREKYRRLS